MPPGENLDQPSINLNTSQPQASQLATLERKREKKPIECLPFTSSSENSAPHREFPKARCFPFTWLASSPVFQPRHRLLSLPSSLSRGEIVYFVAFRRCPALLPCVFFLFSIFLPNASPKRLPNDDDATAALCPFLPLSLKQGRSFVSS